MWVYHTGPIGQFGSLTYILASFEIVSKGTFYMWDCVKAYTFQTGPLWKPRLPENFSQVKLGFFSFYICFIRLKFAVLFVHWNKPNSANQLLNFNCNSYPLVWFHCVPFHYRAKIPIQTNIVLSLIGCKEKSYFRRQISIKSFGNACSFSFSMSPSVVASFACFLSDIPLTLIMTFKSPSTSQRNSFQMMLLTMQLLPHRHFHFIMTTFFFLILVSCVFENNKELSCKLLGVTKRYNLQ